MPNSHNGKYMYSLSQNIGVKGGYTLKKGWSEVWKILNYFLEIIINPREKGRLISYANRRYCDFFLFTKYMMGTGENAF